MARFSGCGAVGRDVSAEQFRQFGARFTYKGERFALITDVVHAAPVSEGSRARKSVRRPLNGSQECPWRLQVTSCPRVRSAHVQDRDRLRSELCGGAISYAYKCVNDGHIFVPAYCQAAVTVSVSLGLAKRL